MRKGRRKPLDACLLNQKLLLFFQSNFPVVFPSEPTFWYCRRADGKGSDLLWAVVDRKESNSRFLPKSTLHVGSLALLCPGLLFPSLSNHKYLLTLQGNLLVSFSFFFFTHSFLISEVYLGLGWHGRYTVPLCHYIRDHFVTAYLKA